MSHVSDIRLRAAEGSWENCSWPAELASGFNIYAYTGGDPLNGTDPSGLDSSPEGENGQGIGSGVGGSTADSNSNSGGGGGSNSGSGSTTPTPPGTAPTIQPVNQNAQGVANFINNNPVVGARFFSDYADVTIVRNPLGSFLGAIPAEASTVIAAGAAAVIVALYPNSTATDDVIHQPIFRAVGVGEYTQIQMTQQYQIQLGGVEGKYFATNLSDARAWKNDLNAAAVVTSSVTPQTYAGFYVGTMDGRTALFADPTQLVRVNRDAALYGGIRAVP